MTRQLTEALRRALASGRKVIASAGPPPLTLDEEDELEVEEAPVFAPQESPERAEPEEDRGT